MEKLFDKIVRGQLVLEDKVVLGEIGITSGKISEISDKQGLLASNHILDFDKKYIFPGFIDVHLHCFSNPNEGFTNVSHSAAVGGITSFLDMPYDLPNPINNVEEFNCKKERLQKESVVDVGLIATIKKQGGLDQIAPLAEAGAAAFKMSLFETDPYRFPRIPDHEILQAFELIKETGLRVGFHAENDDIINPIVNQFIEEGKVYPLAHPESRPPVSETSAVVKLLDFAYWTGVKLHIFHVTHPRCIDLIQQFKKDGVDVTSETCSHYLLLNQEDLNKYGPLAKMNPPLRSADSVEGLWRQLKTGDIDFITSDHAPWYYEDKAKGNDNIFKSPSGLPGVETLVPLMFDAAVASGRVAPVDFAKLLSTNPAHYFNIKNKGAIKIGYDADLTVIDGDERFQIKASEFQSLAKWSPYDGMTLQGKVKQTIVRGETVYDGEKIVKDPGFGKFITGIGGKEKVKQ
ncbi:dihydroorotase [Anaerobacillus sp. MEB173]|uniref:dihydroorotase n=1 Tax=Anaerobacillus sp. MEB173 TaxID=3383345 RepID=UPI003F936039